MSVVCYPTESGSPSTSSRMSTASLTRAGRPSVSPRAASRSTATPDGCPTGATSPASPSEGAEQRLVAMDAARSKHRARAQQGRRRGGGIEGSPKRLEKLNVSRTVGRLRHWLGIMNSLNNSYRQVSSLVFVLLTAGALAGCAGRTISPETRDRFQALADSMQESEERRRRTLVESFDRVGVLLDTALDYLRTSWVKEGGEVNPLGQVGPIRFRRSGWAPEAIPGVYSRATSSLTIACSQVPPLLVVSVRSDPRLDGLSKAIGQARIDDGPLHPIKWQDAGSLTVATVLAGGERLVDPNFADLREPMQAGDTLTVSAPTDMGMLFFRFVLDGLEAQTNQCSTEASEVVEQDTFSVTKSLR